MAQKTDAQLIAEANIIRNETAIGANTALRIGIMLDNVIDSKTNNDIVSNAPLGTSTSIVPTQNAVKTYADGLVTGLLDDRGNFDASTGGSPYPTLNGSGVGSIIQKGDIYFISVAGTVGTTPVSIGSSVRALVDTPAQTPANWDVLDAGVGYIAEPAANKSDATNLGGVSPSHTLFPTQYAVKSYVDGTFNPVIGWTTENVANKIQDLTIAPTSTVQYPSSAAVTTYAEPLTNKSNDNTLGGITPSSTLFPTQDAVKTYVDAHTSPDTLQSVVAAGHTTDAPLILMKNSTGSGLALESNVSDAIGGIFIDSARGVNVHLSDKAGNGLAILKVVDSLYDVKTIELPNASGIIPLTVNGVGADSVGNIVVSGGGGVNTIKVSLTSADILALFATPFVLIPAQGAGTLINVVKAWYRYNFVTTPYTGGGLMTINLGSLPMIQGASGMLALSTTSIGRPSTNTSVFITSGGYENTDLVLNVNVAQTLGDGTFDVYLTYDVITL